jgi:hypothetical protein
MKRPRRAIKLPEVFLGMLSVAVAVVLIAGTAADTIRERRRDQETISVTGSARRPISSNLVNWSLEVSTEAARLPQAAQRLRSDVAGVRAFLIRGGIPVESISLSVVTSEKLVEQLTKRRRRISYRVEQELHVSTQQIDVVERVAPTVGELIARGVRVSPYRLAYISTELTHAKIEALDAATHETRKRAEILVRGLGGKLGSLRSSSQGVFQVTPRNSTDVSDYGINDTSTREKDVTAVVSATFSVKR